jgi:hypothetical protein
MENYTVTDENYAKQLSVMEDQQKVALLMKGKVLVAEKQFSSSQ